MARLVPLNADYLLATILAERPSVSVGALSGLQRDIEEVCPRAVVDVSNTSIASAVQYYPAIFQRKETEIARAPTANEYLMSAYYSEEFESGVPEDVRQVVKQAVAKLAR